MILSDRLCVTGAALGIGILLLSDASSACAAKVSPAPLAITLKPGKAGADGLVPDVEVTVVAPDGAARSGEPLARLPLIANTVVTSAKDLQGFAIEDAAGPVEVTIVDERLDDSNVMRIWKAGRRTSGGLKLHYLVSIDAKMAPLMAPQYELRTDAGAFSGAATAFLVLPVMRRARRISLHWDLAAMGFGATGASSFGVGDVTPARNYSLDELKSTYYMAGTLGLYQRSSSGHAFFGVWQGAPPFDGAALMRWTNQLHEFYGTFFRNTPPSFGVFMRQNRRNPGSGIGLTDSFALTYNATSSIDELRMTLAHEMVHTWVGSLDSTMDEAGGLPFSWFGEGLAVHYERALSWRAGLITPSQFLDDVNFTAGRYYTSAMIGVPNAEIPARFWLDTRVRTLPYDRGSLYFAKLDADIKAASGGKRSLDDLVRSMLALRKRGKRMGLAQWESVLVAELGKQGLADFHAMLGGSLVLPPSEAFGACFRRTVRPLRRYELGFDPAVLRANPRIVTGLIEGSAAARAGLRNGDEILEPVSQDAIQGQQDAYQTLEIRRAAGKLKIRYQPRAQTLDAYQWELNPDRAKGSCAG